MKCVVLAVLMALAVANATIFAPSPSPLTYVYAPNFAARSIPTVLRYALPSPPSPAFHAAPQFVFAAPRLAPYPAPIESVRVVAPPTVAVAVPNAAVYRASNPGVTHEAILPGHSQSVFSENLELPPAGAE